MKIKLLLLLLALNYGSFYAQIPTNDLSKAYIFSNLSLTNVANPGTYDLAVSGTNNATASADPSNNTNEAIDLNNTTFNGGLHQTGTGDFTISFWVKTLTNSQARIINQFNNVSNLNAGYFMNILSNGNLHFTGNFRYGSNYSTQGSVFSNPVNDGNWHHIVITGQLIERVQTFPNGVTQKYFRYRYSIYQDNIFIQNNDTSEIQEGGNQQIFLFSNNPELILGSASFSDEIDNYREYNRLLTVSEIGELFNEFSPNIIFVDIDATGANDGSNWEDAYTDFNSAVTTLNDNDEIWIAQGTYYPPNRSTILTIANTGVKIYGGFAAGETQISDRIFGANETIISGDLANNDGIATPPTSFTFPPSNKSDNAFTIFNITNYSNTNPTIFDGLSIAHAFIGNAVNLNQSGSIIPNIEFRNCQFKYNAAERGAAVAVYNFRNNSTSITSKITFDQCVFQQNASFRGSGIYFQTNNSTIGNVGDQNIEITITNSLFEGNRTGEDFNGSFQPPYDGSAFFILRRSDRFSLITKIINNTFVNNTDRDTYTTTISANNTNSNSTIEFRNNIFWDNTAGGSTATALNAFASSPTVFNSIDKDGFSNIPAALKNSVSTADPLFVDASNSNFALQTTSPAINAGLNSAVITASDLLNNNRIFNTTVDMGAYEFNSALSTSDFETGLDIKIYPNPTSNVFTIQSKKVLKLVEVYSVTGKKLITSNLNTVNVSSLKTGLYLIKVEDFGGNLSTLKFIKN